MDTEPSAERLSEILPKVRAWEALPKGNNGPCTSFEELTALSLRYRQLLNLSRIVSMEAPSTVEEFMAARKKLHDIFEQERAVDEKWKEKQEQSSS